MGNWKLLRKGGDSPSKWDPPGYGLGNITAAAAAAAENTNTSAASQCSSTQWRNMSCSPGEDVKKPAYIANVSDPGTCCSLCSKRVKRGAAVVAFNWRSDNSRCFCKDGDDTKQVPGPCVRNRCILFIFEPARVLSTPMPERKRERARARERGGERERERERAR